MEKKISRDLRALWLREGDKNNKIFHMVANSNRRNNTVDSLVNGLLSLKSRKIREHVVQFYNRLYLEQLSWRPNLDRLTFTSIGDDEILCVTIVCKHKYHICI